MKRFLPVAAALLLLWIVLVGSLDRQELLVGLVVAVLVGAVAVRTVEPLTTSTRPILLRISYLIAYVPYLLFAIVRANLDVAARVVNPRLPIKPGIVLVKTRLRSPLGRLLLSSSITLTPGTLTVDMDGEELYIHWIEIAAEDVEGATSAIVAGFERYLEVVFG